MSQFSLPENGDGNSESSITHAPPTLNSETAPPNPILGPTITNTPKSTAPPSSTSSQPYSSPLRWMPPAFSHLSQHSASSQSGVPAQFPHAYGISGMESPAHLQHWMPFGIPSHPDGNLFISGQQTWDEHLKQADSPPKTTRKATKSTKKRKIKDSEDSQTATAGLAPNGGGQGNGRKQGVPNWSSIEVDHMLDLIGKTYPLGGNLWMKLELLYNDWAEESGYAKRSASAIRSQFKSKADAMIPTGDPDCPPDVRRAKHLSREMAEAINLETINEHDDEYTPLDLDDPSESTQTTEPSGSMEPRQNPPKQHPNIERSRTEARNHRMEKESIQSMIGRYLEGEARRSATYQEQQSMQNTIELYQITIANLMEKIQNLENEIKEKDKELREKDNQSRQLENKVRDMEMRMMVFMLTKGNVPPTNLSSNPMADSCLPSIPTSTSFTDIFQFLSGPLAAEKKNPVDTGKPNTDSDCLPSE